jgi:hypothetical protein
MNKEMDRVCLIFELPDHLPGLLFNPTMPRMRGTASDMHTTSTDLDEKEHVDGLEKQ